MTHKLSTALIAIAAALAVPASAAARTHHCKPTKSFDLSLRANGATSCSQAQALERYTKSHESLDGSFFAAKRQWLGAITSRAGGHTHEEYLSPGRKLLEVWIVVNGEVS